MQLISLQKNGAALESHEVKFWDTSWDFKTAYTKYSNHGLHTYPAMMIPQIARRLIETYGKHATVILDPFMGSGTALLEAKLHPNFKKAYGIDINPLALLISKVKTTPINPKLLWKEYHQLINRCVEDRKSANFKGKSVLTHSFINLDFWFKPEVTQDLVMIKNNIDLVTIPDKKTEQDVKDFFLVAFSEVVRDVSNTRNREYKLYRMSEEILKKHNPNTLQVFRDKLKSNAEQMEEYFKEQNNMCEVRILAEDSRAIKSIPNSSVDLIVTSPPYGDSGTTVAYGQFSRLGLQWLGYDKDTVLSIDRVSLGGIPTIDLTNDLRSPTLKKTLAIIAEQDPKRARDVLSFYVDFDKCIKELHRVTKEGAFLCFVVGNRTVKGVQIPTDEIIVELFQAKNHYRHVNTFIRNIPYKRMPKLNSPTNITGNHAVTMNEEWIIILEKQ
ncbi:DNA methyltransferase [Candidatus Woesearchaeota archaeon]|nr:DNA methyltransferase [Candidatus Woesearchaeota archaeon]